MATWLKSRASYAKGSVPRHFYLYGFQTPHSVCYVLADRIPDLFHANDVVFMKREHIPITFRSQVPL
jgi:hypothetical protein